MRYLQFSIILLSFFGCKNLNQKINQETVNQADSSILLIQKIKSADTILLVSHIGPSDDEITQREIQPQLIINNKINKEIIKEQIILTSKEVDTLTNILSIIPPDIDSLSAKCCEPHHTIFLIARNNTSYIDLCFHCNCISASKDLSPVGPFGLSKWQKLLVFFKTLGFKYELPVN